MRKGILLLLALVCVALSPFASSLPDGLETVIEGQHLATFIQDLTWPIFTDYGVSVVSNPYISGWLAGSVGMAIVWLCAMAVLIAKRNQYIVTDMK